MEENKSGQDETQNVKAEEQTSQNEQPYKSFTEEEWKSSQDKFYQKAYNEGKSKAAKDLINEFGLELDENDLEVAINSIKQRQAPQEESKDTGELDELREMYQSAQAKIEEYENSMRMQNMQRAIDAQANQAFDSVDGELTLDKNDIMALYFANNEVDEQDGNYFVVKDGRPELDDNGNRKSLSNSISDFVRRKGFLKPNKQGAGGSTGGVDVNSGKPSRKRWSELVKSKSAGAHQEAAKLYNLAKETGWAEE